MENFFVIFYKKKKLNINLNRSKIYIEIFVLCISKYWRIFNQRILINKILSIGCFCLIFDPFVKCLLCVWHLNVVKTYHSLFHVFSYFIIDKFVIEFNFCQAFFWVGEDNSCSFWPVNGTKTHGAWLTACVNCTVK